jgi:hypothetical protein
MSTRKKSAKGAGRTFAYDTWSIARVAQEIRRIRPEIIRKAAAEAAIRQMSVGYEADGEKPIPIEYMVRVKKATQTLENRNAEVRAFAWFEAWYAAHEQPSPIKEAAEEAIRRFIDQ